MHSADVVNRFFVHVDGQTNCEQILEGSYSEVMFEFGQCVLYTVSAKPQGGLWLGTRFVTEEHLRVGAWSWSSENASEIEYEPQLFAADLIGVPWNCAGKNVILDGVLKENQSDVPRREVPRGPEESLPQISGTCVTKDWEVRKDRTVHEMHCRRASWRFTVSHSQFGMTGRDGPSQDPVYSRRLGESQLRRGDISERRAEVLGKRKTCGEEDDQDKTDPLR